MWSCGSDKSLTALASPARPSGFTSGKACSPPRRGPNGYRDYDDSTVARLRFIRTAQTAGLTLGEIASIVDLRDDGEVPCSHVHTLLLNKLHDVRARQRELAGLEAELEHRIARSHKLDPADCTSTQICNILSARD